MKSLQKIIDFAFSKDAPAVEQPPQALEAALPPPKKTVIDKHITIYMKDGKVLTDVIRTFMLLRDGFLDRVDAWVTDDTRLALRDVTYHRTPGHILRTENIDRIELREETRDPTEIELCLFK